MTLITEKTDRMSKISLASKGFPHEEMMHQLQEKINEIPYKGKETFLNTPVQLGEESLKDYAFLSHVLHHVFERVVINYLQDERLQDIYQLDDFFNAVIDTANQVPYQVGFYRPDFVYDTTGQEKICEIGCRYPINGWMLSHYLNEVSEQFAKQTNMNWSAIPEQSGFFAEFEKKFNKDEPVFLVHKREKGTEVNYLIKELAEKGIRIVSITPEELTLEEGVLMGKGEAANQFFLELDREELRLFDQLVLKALILKGNCINDVRSIILLHDKRIMAVLYDHNIMINYISGEDYDFLKKFLIPTFTLNNQQNKDFLLITDQNWILKPNSGGRGIDVFIKDECTPETWKDIVTNKWKDYMVQNYIEQQKFTIVSGGEKREINLVGLILCCNNKSYGPGLFRGSSDSVINLHEGRGVVLPCVLDKSIE
ncbi:MAG: hypothetical protein JKY02_01765 [Flavobacteriaceae bacterium]|nr:hypothetical protein [Flavobacteriaceae bacterium]